MDKTALIDEKPVELPAKKFELLALLIENQGKTLKKSTCLALSGAVTVIRSCKHSMCISTAFARLNNVPQELARGNLAVPIPGEKNVESIEDNRKKEITMQRDKKLLLLSLSHDIKTPLSANGEVYAEIRDGCFYITLVVKMA